MILCSFVKGLRGRYTYRYIPVPMAPLIDFLHENITPDIHINLCGERCICAYTNKAHTCHIASGHSRFLFACLLEPEIKCYNPDVFYNFGIQKELFV